MRIRKRQLPLLFSSDSSESSSDPPVQLRCATPRGGHPPNPLPHHNNTASFGKENKLLMTLEDDDYGEEEETREIRRVFGAETSYIGVLPQQTTSSPQGVVGRWCEREKAFPLKKRRGSFERPTEDEDHNNEEIATTATNSSETIIKKNMKTKMNKKCTTLSPPQQKQEPEESKVGPDLAVAAGKKQSRGGTLMEGSRCSRVNGRGWRCCQQTLVGYSLCEHHLGKGRLRSINTVRRRSLAAAMPKRESLPPPPPLTVASKNKVKLGVVKARSISSLLGQTDNVMAPPRYPLPLPPPDDNINEQAQI